MLTDEEWRSWSFPGGKLKFDESDFRGFGAAGQSGHGTIILSLGHESYELRLNE